MILLLSADKAFEKFIRKEIKKNFLTSNNR